jgi:hypothetical protein
MQTSNPLGFYCAPNHSTPDYVTYDDFAQFVAYGLMSCWLSHDANDPNADCNMARPVTVGDVADLRTNFLDALEEAIIDLWREDKIPGEGILDQRTDTVVIGLNDEENDGHEDTLLRWYVRLDHDAIMMELDCTDADPECIWLGYEGIEDRKNVLKVLQNARKVVGQRNVYDSLVSLVEPDVMYTNCPYCRSANAVTKEFRDTLDTLAKVKCSDCNKFFVILTSTEFTIHPDGRLHTYLVSGGAKSPSCVLLAYNKQDCRTKYNKWLLEHCSRKDFGATITELGEEEILICEGNHGEAMTIVNYDDVDNGIVSSVIKVY